MNNENPSPLAGRVAVVTGATSGIGEATARALAAGGAAVALVGRRADRLDALAAELGGPGTALAIPADVSDPAALARVAAATNDALGRADLVVANAGAMLGAPFEDADPAEWDRMIDLNLRGLLHTGRVSRPTCSPPRRRAVRPTSCTSARSRRTSRSRGSESTPRRRPP